MALVEARTAVLAPLALALLAACGSSASTPTGAEGTDGSAESGPPLADASSKNPADDAATSSSGGAVQAGPDAVAPEAAPPADGAARPDAAAVWKPTTDAPIHFHWFIGATPTFQPSDVLSGQNGQVVYDIDGAGATQADVDAIHAAGATAVCYVDVGSLEQGRPDYADFPSSVVGPAVQGWPGENWLLVTAANQSTILSLMRARFLDWCQAKGFDAIEPDNLDAWTNISGVSETDNLAYDLAIADLAHSLSMSIGLKNVMTDLDPSQYPEFLAAFDWALNEQCYEYGECAAYSASGSFLPAGKAVFDVEYSVAPTCTQADQAHMNAQQTDLDLVGPTESGYTYAPCVPDSQDTW